MDDWSGAPVRAAWDARLLPLLLASDALAPEEPEREPLDGVRIQKGVFLLEEDGPSVWSAFEFVAWNWGPFSRSLAAAVDRLVAEGLLELRRVPFRQYPAYATTSEGERIVRETLAGMPQEEIAFIRRVRRYVTSRSFNQLLREVYAAHPEYATRSQFRY